MVAKKVALIGIEATNPRRRLHVDSHTAKRIAIGDGRDECFARVLERNETPVKEVIDGRGEEQTITGSESFLIRGFPPRLNVAGDKVNRVGNTSQPAVRSQFG